MKLLRQVLSTFTLLFVFSSTASATGISLLPLLSNSGCGGTQQPVCDLEYSKSFETDTFKYDSTFNKYYFRFGALDKLGDNFKITAATLTVTTNADGLFDSILAENNQPHLFEYSKVGLLNDSDNNLFTDNGLFGNQAEGTQTFTLDYKLFDEIVSGIRFKAWFSSANEYIKSATLDVSGKYCPPVSQVPVPAAAFLFAPALMGFVGLRRKAAKKS